MPVGWSSPVLGILDKDSSTLIGHSEVCAVELTAREQTLCMCHACWKNWGTWTFLFLDLVSNWMKSQWGELLFRALRWVLKMLQPLFLKEPQWFYSCGCLQSSTPSRNWINWRNCSTISLYSSGNVKISENILSVQSSTSQYRYSFKNPPCGFWSLLLWSCSICGLVITCLWLKHGHRQKFLMLFP